MTPDIGNLFKFFKEPEHARTLLNDSLLHFQNPKKFETLIGEVNQGFGIHMAPFHVKNLGVACFTHSNECWKSNEMWADFASGGNGVIVGFQESPRRHEERLIHEFDKEVCVALPFYAAQPESNPKQQIDHFPENGLAYVPIKGSEHQFEQEYRLCAFDFDRDADFLAVHWSANFYAKSVIFHESWDAGAIESFITLTKYDRPIRYCSRGAEGLRLMYVASAGTWMRVQSA